MVVSILVIDVTGKAVDVTGERVEVVVDVEVVVVVVVKVALVLVTRLVVVGGVLVVNTGAGVVGWGTEKQNIAYKYLALADPGVDLSLHFEFSTKKENNVATSIRIATFL